MSYDEILRFIRQLKDRREALDQAIAACEQLRGLLPVVPGAGGEKSVGFQELTDLRPAGKAKP